PRSQTVRPGICGSTRTGSRSSNGADDETTSLRRSVLLLRRDLHVDRTDLPDPDDTVRPVGDSDAVHAVGVAGGRTRHRGGDPRPGPPSPPRRGLTGLSVKGFSAGSRETLHSSACIRSITDCLSSCDAWLN